MYLLHKPIIFNWYLTLLLVHAVTKTPIFYHITPILKSLHWLKINERIEYKVLSHTYKSLITGQSSYALFFHPLHIVLLGLLLNQSTYLLEY